MNILSIESSCDETAAAVLQTGENFPSDPTDFKLLSNVVVSQIDIFKAYGGVIPEVAARSHLEAILPVLHQALSKANLTWPQITHISVTHTPGLLGSLLIGTLTARTLAILHNKPFYPIHHLKSHIYSALLPDPKSPTSEKSPTSKAIQNGFSPNGTISGSIFLRENTIGKPPVTTGGLTGARNSTVGEKAILNSRSLQFPALALVVSGGHTQIIKITSHTTFKIISTTRDDAVGECFDKVAKILGLPYPGGPAISKTAKSGDPHKYPLPHPILKNPDGSHSLDFSFSGLKTAVLRAVQKECNLPLNHPSHDLKNHLTKKQIADFAASFEETAVSILAENLLKSAKIHNPKSIIIAGGVSANSRLRQKITQLFTNN
ncbi:tRNA (adenosine(37)-N6)-threonylcarbamoyltransferase complex transferase subunit TsaD, partial [Candidatus Saccharibacteria bacterium]|nr:tRNA (adenosine(37)-N6)-threonylcarbamoyltransferase complex transferase subunit TsaD [Candidatus Saccharibacteria bacterium]